MKINKLLMEDWLADNQFIKYNLAESGYYDFSLGEILSHCEMDINCLNTINLANPDTRGSMELRSEIVKCYDSVKIENVLVTTGVTEALFTFFNTILNNGDEVIVEYPEFQTLYELPKAIGCDIKYLNLKNEQKYVPCIEELSSLITSKTKLIIINNPHNPTGSMISNDFVLDLVTLAKKHNIFILFDEHYKFLTLENGDGMMQSGYDICSDRYDRIVATGSITKCFGVNGLRIGWLIANEKIIEDCREYKHYLTHVTSPISDYIATLILKNKYKIIRSIKENVLTNVRLLNDFMEKYDCFFEYVKPQGGLVAFPKIIGKINPDIFCKDLLQKYNVSLLPGENFGMKNHFRINFGIKSVQFIEALNLIEVYLNP